MVSRQSLNGMTDQLIRAPWACGALPKVSASVGGWRQWFGVMTIRLTALFISAPHGLAGHQVVEAVRSGLEYLTSAHMTILNGNLDMPPRPESKNCSWWRQCVTGRRGVTSSPTSFVLRRPSLLFTCIVCRVGTAGTHIGCKVASAD